MTAKKDLPPPDNLGSRQKSLNKKVIDAVANNIDFNTVKDEPEFTEVDRFFKIDLAAKYKNVDYILETLKLESTLYVTRALKKSQWLYGDEFSHIINPEYLEANIFPDTSARVKRLILKTVATRVRKDDRAVEFFNYCLENNYPEIAFKCLHFTNESFKLNILRNFNKPPFSTLIRINKESLQLIIGKSVALFEAYLEIDSNNRSEILIKFRHFYSVNEVKYLELLEKYNAYHTYSKFDDELSKDIMTKHKERVLNNPTYYVERMNQDILLKNSSVEDVKVYLKALMASCNFWGGGFLYEYSDYFDKIPKDEIYGFLKILFTDKYPGDDFEMHKCFYTSRFYEYMSVEEREEWAWKQIKSEKQVLGVGKDYLWYKFINFKDAFEEIKRYIIVTTDAERRKGIVNVLIHSARNSRDLETLFRYYHRRHNNELKLHKEYFLEKVVDIRNVFEFDEPCFNAFYTLLENVELYDTSEYEGYNIQMIWTDIKYKLFKNVVLFYHILHEKDMPERLQKYLVDEFYPEEGTGNVRDTQSLSYILVKMNDQQRDFVYNFLFKFYMDKITQIKNEPFTKNIQQKMERYSEMVKQLMKLFYPSKDIYKSDWETRPPKQPPKAKKVENMGIKLMRELKKDKTLVMDTLLEISKQFETNPTNIDWFLQKIKIYFPGDLTQDIIETFEKLLTKITNDQKTVDACVKAIFELSDPNQIGEFMKKYAPENTKIDHNNIDPHRLRIQKAICKYACISRPPVSLSFILLYMKGDYVQYLLHVFSTYSAILPPSECTKFVEAFIDAPVSIQKHAIRLSFKCFDENKMKQICLTFWKKTKNVSVRLAIYKGLYNRQVQRKEKELFHALKILTLDLNEDDDRAIFGFTASSTLPDKYIGEYKEVAWTAVSQFKEKQPHIQRKCNLLYSFPDKIDLMKEEFLFQIVDEHLKMMLTENLLYLCHSDDLVCDLYNAKWIFIYNYILHFSTVNTYEKHLDITKFIVKKCLEKWQETYDGKNIYQDRIWDLYRQFNDMSLKNASYFENSLSVFETILKTVESESPVFETYKLRWELHLAIANRKALNLKSTYTNKNLDATNESLTNFGKEVGNLVSNMVRNKVYFSYHSEYVKNVICNKVKELLRVTLADYKDDDTTSTNKALLSFILGLVELEQVETCMLALQIIPTDADYPKDGYQALIDKIKKYNHPDVQYALHQVRNVVK